MEKEIKWSGKGKQVLQVFCKRIFKNCLNYDTQIKDVYNEIFDLQISD